jgi:hypothetical protein
MGIEAKLEMGKKNYAEKNLEAIRIIRDEVVDIINGQGCLMQPLSTTLFGPDDQGKVAKIKEFDLPYKATSHGYMYCAEVVGRLSSGERFYIHARSPFELEKMLSSMIEVAQKESPEEKVIIGEVSLRSDFDGYVDEADEAERNKSDYRKRLGIFGVGPDTIELRNESISGLTPEKVVGYDTEEDRLKF